MPQNAFVERFEQLGDTFKALALPDPMRRLNDLANEIGRYGVQAARTLDEATNAGVFPRYAEVRTTIQRFIERGIFPKHDDRDERLFFFWLQAIGSWLAKDYPNELSANAAAVDWAHYKRDPDIEPVHETVQDANGRIVHRTYLPEGAFVEDQSMFGLNANDEVDAINRQRMRARNWCDVCKLLGRLAREVVGQGGPPASSSGDDKRDKISPARHSPEVPKDVPAQTMSGEARALAVLTDHPDWTDIQIAEAAGVNRTTLYSFEKFKKARAMLRDQGKHDAQRQPGVRSGQRKGRIGKPPPDTLPDT